MPGLGARLGHRKEGIAVLAQCSCLESQQSWLGWSSPIPTAHGVPQARLPQHLQLCPALTTQQLLPCPQTQKHCQAQPKPNCPPQMTSELWSWLCLARDHGIMEWFRKEEITNPTQSPPAMAGTAPTVPGCSSPSVQPALGHCQGSRGSHSCSGHPVPALPTLPGSNSFLISYPNLHLPSFSWNGVTLS